MLALPNQNQPKVTTSLRARKGVAIPFRDIPRRNQFTGDCHVGLRPPRNDVVALGWFCHKVLDVTT